MLKKGTMTLWYELILSNWKMILTKFIKITQELKSKFLRYKILRNRKMMNWIFFNKKLGL